MVCDECDATKLSQWPRQGEAHPNRPQVNANATEYKKSLKFHGTSHLLLRKHAWETLHKKGMTTDKQTYTQTHRYTQRYTQKYTDTQRF